MMLHPTHELESPANPARFGSDIGVFVIFFARSPALGIGAFGVAAGISSFAFFALVYFAADDKRPAPFRVRVFVFWLRE